MKQGSNSRRPRGRNNKRSPNRNNGHDNSGPEGRIRGNASQVYEKYLALARDALSADDRISSENYSQHAEHFYRIMTINAENNKSQSNTGQSNDQASNQKEKSRNRRNRNNNRGNNRGNNRNIEVNSDGVLEDNENKSLVVKDVLADSPKVVKNVVINTTVEKPPEDQVEKENSSPESGSA
jgi:hypothetical protein